MLHKHKCDDCGVVWEHDALCLADHTAAHKCPKCGKEQRTKYSGKDPATVKHDGKQTIQLGG